MREYLKTVGDCELQYLVNAVADDWIRSIIKDEIVERQIKKTDTQPQAEEVYSKTIEPLERGRVYKGVPIAKSTPEQKEEWEEDFRGFLDFVIEDDSNKKEVVEYVKNLLDERETKAFNEGVKEMEDSEQIQADWDIEELGNIVDKIVKKLDKLNKKK